MAGMKGLEPLLLGPGPSVLPIALHSNDLYCVLLVRSAGLGPAQTQFRRLVPYPVRLQAHD